MRSVFISRFSFQCSCRALQTVQPARFSRNTSTIATVSRHVHCRCWRALGLTKNPAAIRGSGVSGSLTQMALHPDCHAAQQQQRTVPQSKCTHQIHLGYQSSAPVSIRQPHNPVRFRRFKTQPNRIRQSNPTIPPRKSTARLCCAPHLNQYVRNRNKPTAHNQAYPNPLVRILDAR